MVFAAGDILAGVTRVLDVFGGSAAGTFLSLGSNASLASLAAALVVATAFLMVRRKGRPVKLKAFLRALFPRRWLFGPSAKADLGFMVLNTFLTGVLLGWAVLSAKAIAGISADGLTALFGASPLVLPALACGLIATVVMFLAYELGHWTDHYLSHKVPFLWAFHKVHHTAETLAPWTNFRLHPIDGLVFSNILAVTLGAAGGGLTYLFGEAADPFTLSGMNVIMAACVFTFIHLQHSHVWIAWRGWPGRIFLSPAHHQIHHSTNPEHFDRNLGGALCLWDWVFGTLHIPQVKRERLSFGIENAEQPHTITGALVTPFIEAWRTIVPVKPRPVPAPTV